MVGFREVKCKKRSDADGKGTGLAFSEKIVHWFRSIHGIPNSATLHSKISVAILLIYPLESISRNVSSHIEILSRGHHGMRLRCATTFT